DLVARGVPVDAASVAVLTAARAGATDGSLLRIRERIRTRIESGTAPAGAGRGARRPGVEGGAGGEAGGGRAAAPPRRRARAERRPNRGETTGVSRIGKHPGGHTMDLRWRR